MMKTYLLGAVLAASALIPAAANADPVLWSVADGGNGHYYEFRFDEGRYNFYSAHSAALASTYMGMSGYLATITSAAENAFIYNHVSTAAGYIGGSDQASEGTWTWLDGPEAGGVFYSTSGAPLDYAYSSWLPGEPNDGGIRSNEDVMLTNYEQQGGWNDVNASDQTGFAGYFVEYGAAAVTGAVPEPASWAMMIVGFGMIGAGMRYRQRRTVLRYL